MKRGGVPVIVLFLVFLLNYQRVHLLQDTCAANDDSCVEHDSSLLEENLSFCTTHQNGVKKCGKKFSKKWLPYLEKLGLLDSQTDKITENDDIATLNLKPIFVMPSDYFYVGRSMYNGLNSTTLLNPMPKIILVDLGLKQGDYERMVHAYPNIKELYKFNFAKYPQYFTQLKQYRWKPLLIAEMLKRHNAVFYVDGGVRFPKIDPSTVYSSMSCNKDKPNACEKYPLNLLCHVGHNIFAATDPMMFEYFPIDVGLSQTQDMGCAGFQMVYGTKDVKQNIMKWIVLCALEEDCMSPPNRPWLPHRKCEWKGKTNWAQCHREDQSAYNMLLIARHGNNRNKYLTNYRYF